MIPPSEWQIKMRGLRAALSNCTTSGQCQTAPQYLLVRDGPHLAIGNQFGDKCMGMFEDAIVRSLAQNRQHVRVVAVSQNPRLLQMCR